MTDSLPSLPDRLRELGDRRPSIGDDGNVVLAAAVEPFARDLLSLPTWATPYHLVPLIKHGYARYDEATKRYVLTESGRELHGRWAEIRGHAVAESKPYGLLTPPSPGEIRDNEHPDGNGQSLLRGRR